MPSRTKIGFLALLAAVSLPAATFTYHVAGDDPGPWPAILSSLGLTRSAGGPADLIIARTIAPGSAPQWIDRIEHGAIVVLEGDNDLAAALGISPTGKRVVVRSIVDRHAPKVPIIWAAPAELPIFMIPCNAEVMASERWEHAPMVAAIRRGSGAVLWMAAFPGVHGYEHFPYLLQALSDLGIQAPFRSRGLWAFFDGAYRSRVDLDYFAARWREAGIGALHVAGWHYFEHNTESDAYLTQLIEACHRQAILVYVWLELPHVSEEFWASHPEWREKTALQQDAQLDWRKLMNLTNREAFGAAAHGVNDLIQRFDWDGVNLAELYFESLEGAANPARFTPMNADVRREFQAQHGFDPLGLFASGRPDEARLKIFLDYRADLVRRQQQEWLEQIDAIRTAKPGLDLVLTHVDDRFDPRIRDLIGADTSRTLPLLDQHDFTFLIEDPATIWNLGPERYPQIAAEYQPLTKQTSKLAIDINIVERYQEVYPTKQQTGTELFQLVHVAAQAFPQVALYFENSILAADLPLLSSAAASVDKVAQNGSKLTIDTRYGTGVRWRGPALVNGHPWPVRDEATLWVPAGLNVIEPTQKEAALRIVDFNGNLKSANASSIGLEFSYDSRARSIAILTAQPRRIEVDGVAVEGQLPPAAKGFLLTLPRGQHLVQIAQ